MNKILGGGLVVLAIGLIGVGSKLLVAKPQTETEAAPTEEAPESSEEDGSSQGQEEVNTPAPTNLAKDFDWDYNRKGILEGKELSDEDKDFFFNTPESITDDVPNMDANTVIEDQYFTTAQWNTLDNMTVDWKQLSFDEKVAKIQKDCDTLKQQALKK